MKKEPEATLQMEEFSASRSAWAWLILFSAFLCTAVVDGLCFTFGLHLLEMMQASEFNTGTNRETPSFMLLLLPGALLTGGHLYASPLANTLVNCFDYRPVAMVSAFLTGGILITSTFMTKLDQFAPFFGLCGAVASNMLGILELEKSEECVRIYGGLMVSNWQLGGGGITGISCGLLYFPSLSIVAQWFESRRAFAVGLTICGSGVGTSLMALCMNSAVKTFTWRGFIILIGTVFFQLSVGVACFRPLEVQRIIDIVQSQRHLKQRQKRLERKRAIAAAMRNRNVHKFHQRVSIPHGSIMARIIEEKFRQRTSSTGSLDGMVITRDNQLISLPNANDYEFARAAAAAFTNQSLKPSVTPSGTCNSKLEPPTLHNLPLPSLESQEATEPISPFLLSQPHNFSKSGVIRIADAIMQKLEAQAVIAPGMGCPNMMQMFSRKASNRQTSICAFLSESAYENPSNNSQTTPDKLRRRSEVLPTATSDFWGESNKVCNTRAHYKCGKKTQLKFAHEPRNMSVCPIGSATLLNNPPSVDPNLRPPCLDSISRTSSVGSIDPKTDKAISHELACVNLDLGVKNRIHSYIRHELHRAGQTTHHHQPTISVYPEHSSSRRCSEVRVDDRHYSCVSSEVPCLSCECCSSLQKDISQCPHTGGDLLCVGVNGGTGQENSQQVSHSVGGGDAAVVGNSSGKRKTSDSILFCALSAFIQKKLDLQLFTSPSFILLSLACTLHMSVFFAPVHLLPLFLTFEGDQLTCSDHVERFRSGQHFVKIPGPFANVNHVIFAVGVSHLLGRLIATIYIERSINGPQFTLKPHCKRLADPMVLNILTLAVSAVSAACIPLSVKSVCLSSFTAKSPNSFWGSFSLPLVAMYALTIIHSVASALAISLRSVVAVELIGVYHLSHAFSYLLIFQGTGAILGPLALGMFTEAVSGGKINTNLLDYNSQLAVHTFNPLEPAFYMSALILLLSMLAFAPLRTIYDWEVRRYAKAASLAELKRQQKIKLPPTKFRLETRLTAPACIVTAAVAIAAENEASSKRKTSMSNCLLTAEELCVQVRLQSELALDYTHSIQLETVSDYVEMTDKVGEELLPVAKVVPKFPAIEEPSRKISSCSRASDQSYITFLMPPVTAQH